MDVKIMNFDVKIVNLDVRWISGGSQVDLRWPLATQNVAS